MRVGHPRVRLVVITSKLTARFSTSTHRYLSSISGSRGYRGAFQRSPNVRGLAAGWLATSFTSLYSQFVSGASPALPFGSNPEEKPKKLRSKQILVSRKAERITKYPAKNK